MGRGVLALIARPAVRWAILAALAAVLALALAGCGGASPDAPGCTVSHSTTSEDCKSGS